ncbi:glycoside hydrolase family 43 protein [Marinimicrobium sp. C2-29]|uniref:glycoside hydrolase family 43 protein n=1 Tax=Marinimicrobium sp. C2-29 TaxID=3139825 RepID=UPI003139E5F7
MSNFTQQARGPLSALALSIMLAACGGGSGGSGDSNPDPANGNGNGNGNGSGSVQPTFTNIAVHDPSVIKVESEYYVIGSHLSAAKTGDLMNWQRVADGVTAANPLFDDVTVELADALGWADANTLWAADIVQLEIDGRFYMYYNACRGDAPQSAMGVAVADNIEGPYEDLGIFLRSGWESESALEAGAVTEGYIADNYDPRVHPNVIDPHTFYDHEGKLWMTYGSYSGGLFILQMDPNTGFPLPDQGYGTHLIGGNHSRIEAPYVLYSPESKYYYLYSSFGGLDANGAYNIRVARSVSPDGPYLDYEGNDVANVKSDPSLPIFDDASIEDGAVKLMGNFRFADGGDGYVSPGHNSAYYEGETGKHLLFFHTRFPGRGEQHEVRVHEMFMNADGWPVVAPHRYVPTSESEEPVESAVVEADLPGTYELVNHGKDITSEIKQSITVELEEGGMISGEASGDWTLNADNDITITLDGEGTFEGVAARLWSPSEQEFVVTFSALSEAGVAIWGSRSLD